MRRHSKTSLFLMELILSILLFSLCSAICVQLFVHAHREEEEAAFLNWAVRTCDSAAARIQQEKVLPAPACFDSAFQPCGQEDAVWILEAAETAPDGDPVRQASLTIRNLRDPASGEAPAYTLTVGY